MTKKLNFVGIGEILWDILPQQKILGGAVANFAYYINQLGAEGLVVSVVGDDPLGRATIKTLTERNMQTQYIQTSATYPTGTAHIELDANDKPTYVFQKDAAWDHLEINTKLKTLAKKIAAVTFGTLAQRQQTTRTSINTFVSTTPKDCLRILDINLRQSFYNYEILDNSLRLANILKINDDELETISKIFDLKGSESVILQQLLTHYDLKLIALTKGQHGSRLYSGAQDISHPGLKTQMVDSVGAGDAFNAIVAYGVATNMPLEKIISVANQVAAYVCSQIGATTKLPKQLLQQMK